MNSNNRHNQSQDIKDYGNDPFIVNIDCLAKRNHFYRTALWTGDHLQVTLMSIPVGGDIGLEIHNNLDQFIRIESGTALALMGKSRSSLSYRQTIDSNYAVIIPVNNRLSVLYTLRLSILLELFIQQKQMPKTINMINTSGTAGIYRCAYCYLCNCFLGYSLNLSAI